MGRLAATIHRGVTPAACRCKAVSVAPTNMEMHMSHSGSTLAGPGPYTDLLSNHSAHSARAELQKQKQSPQVRARRSRACTMVRKRPLTLRGLQDVRVPH